MALYLLPFQIIISNINQCRAAKMLVKRNKRRAEHLMDQLEALDQPIKVLSTEQEMERSAISHATLNKLTKAVEDAQALLQRQCKRRSYLSHMCWSSSTDQEFSDMDRRLGDFRESLSVSLQVQMYMSNPPTPDSAPRPAVNRDVEFLRQWRERESTLQHWWSGKDPTTWPGVKIDGDRVTGLNLKGAALTSLPAEIGELEALKELELENNRLTDLPEEIGQLKSLTTLWLYMNQLRRVPAWIGELTSLEVLWLRNNQLTSVPVELGRLTSLKQLYLGKNQLASLPKELGELTSLEQLLVENNRLTGIPEELRNLKSLTSLRLGNNKLWEVPA